MLIVLVWWIMVAFIMGCINVLVGRVGGYRFDHSAGRLFKEKAY